MNNKNLMGPVLVVKMLSSMPAFAGWEALPEVAPAPEDNPTTDAKVTLGKMLFMDPRFSSTGTVSCNSCHKDGPRPQ